MTIAPLAETHGLTRDTFVNEIVPKGQPIVLRGAVSSWAAITQFSDDDDLASYLIDGAGSDPVSIIRAKPSVAGRFFYADNMRDFNFERGLLPFAQFINIMRCGADGDSIYMGSTPMSEGFAGLSNDFDMPLVPAGTEPRLWVGNRTVVSTHHDASSNIACVAAGRRTFTLFPPDQVSNLYPGPIEHTTAGPQLSMVDLDDPDIERYPRYATALESAQSAELGPGDAIYIPPLWWHHVRATSDFNVLVNFWWRDRPEISREPIEAFVLSLLAVRQLPEHERRAWRAMFDYFIFQTDGPPMEHLPEELRGVLGSISPARAQEIWKFFTGMMR